MSKQDWLDNTPYLEQLGEDGIEAVMSSLALYPELAKLKLKSLQAKAWEAHCEAQRQAADDRVDAMVDPADPYALPRAA